MDYLGSFERLSPLIDLVSCNLAQPLKVVLYTFKVLLKSTLIECSVYDENNANVYYCTNLCTDI